MSFDPYYEWLRLPPGPRPPSPETLLGLQAGETDRDLILAAAMKCAGIVRGYGLSKHSEVAAELLREIAQAVQTLEMKSGEHAAMPAHSPGPALSDQPTLAIVQGKPVDLAGETTGPLALGDTMRRQGPSAQPQRQSVGPRDRVPAAHVAPALPPMPRRSLDEIMTQLGGAVRVEPAKPIPSISGERERQHEEESRKVLNSALAIWAAGIVVVLTAILLKALISGNEPSPQVASDDPKTTPAAVGGEKSGSEAAPVASTDIEPKPPEGNSRESSSASEPPGTDATGGNVASGAKAAPSDSTDFKDKPPQSDSMESPSSPEPPGTESDRKPPADSPLSGTDRRKRPAGKAAADVQGDIPVQSPDEPAQPAAKDSQANTRVWIWRDASGKHAMDAEAVGFEEGRVQLEDKTGNRVFVPLEQLSRADQQFVREQFIQAEPKTPPTVAEPGTPRESPQDTVERGVRSTTREETAARAYFNMQRTLRSARNSEKRHRLTEFIATFPGTKAAQRAQEVLETIPLFDSDRSSSLRRR